MKPYLRARLKSRPRLVCSNDPSHAPLAWCATQWQCVRCNWPAIDYAQRRGDIYARGL